MERWKAKKETRERAPEVLRGGAWARGVGVCGSVWVGVLELWPSRNS